MNLTNLFINLLTNLILKTQITKIWIGYFKHLLTWKNLKSAYNNDKFKISAPTWHDEFELPDGSDSISDGQDYFKFTVESLQSGHHWCKKSVRFIEMSAL